MEARPLPKGGHRGSLPHDIVGLEAMRGLQLLGCRRLVDCHQASIGREPATSISALGTAIGAAVVEEGVEEPPNGGLAEAEGGR
jgi:hypothetical protein